MIFEVDLEGHACRQCHKCINIPRELESSGAIFTITGFQNSSLWAKTFTLSLLFSSSNVINIYFHY